MNRIVKFRGKRIDDGEWVYGDGIVIIGDDYAAIPQTKDVTPEHYQIKLCKVIPTTAGEFTGLLDKNKKEIYEGDIILWGWGDDRDTGVISWSKTHFGWEIGIPAAMWKSPGGLKDFWSDRIEVIGNIYENADLLK